MKLFGNGSAAYHGPGFQHAHTQPGPGQVASAGQSIMTSADDDDVRAVFFHCNIRAPMRFTIPPPVAGTGPVSAQ